MPTDRRPASASAAATIWCAAVSRSAAATAAATNACYYNPISYKLICCGSYPRTVNGKFFNANFSINKPVDVSAKFRE
jgi:hypothetical protein